MLHNDLRYVNVDNKIEVHATLEYKNCNFQYIVLNLSMEQKLQNLVHM